MLPTSHFLSVALVSLAILSACDGSGGGPKAGSNPQQQTPAEPDPSPLSDATYVGKINFDGGLSRKERGAFVAAMDYLDETQIMNADQKLLDMMKIPRGDRGTIRTWLEDRIQYIIPEEADLDEKLTIIQKNYTNYENPGVLPPQIKNGMNATSGSVIMSNIGAVVYLTGKAKSLLIGIKADGIGTLLVTSARTGLLRVGEGLFMIPGKYPNLVKIFHLTTLIHESRHSDGNKTTTGFLHEVCPEGDYKGQAACDHNTNGPYEIEALATKSLMQTCVNCSAKESQVLRVLYLDISSRQINDANTTTWDDAPEGHR